MTTPNAGSPDVAFVWSEGTSFGRDMTEESMMNSLTSVPVEAWEVAQQAWKGACTEQRATLADLKDGQNSLRHRLDLLNEVSGYGSAVMGYNWQIPYSQWIVLPFDTQLGPAKGVQVSTPAAETGFLTLKKGGLWRVDSHFTVSGMSIGLNVYVNPGGIPIFYNTYNPIFPKLRIEVVNSSGGLITERQYDLVADIALNSQGLAQQNAPRSGAFSHTFVLDEMPPEDDPSASTHWAHVRLAIRYEPIYSGTLSDTSCKVLGGTKLSSLIATRWSKDVLNTGYIDEVPDGGNLG